MPAAPAGVSVKRIPRGLVSIIEVTGAPLGADDSTIRLPEDHEKFNVPAHTRRVALPFLQGAEANHETYYLANIKDVQVELHEKVKALTVQNASNAKVALLGGCVTQLQVHNCKSTILRIDKPLGSIKLDDCNGVNIHFSHEAARGYRDDGFESGERYLGIVLFHSGCHGIEVHCPTTEAEDSPIMSQLLPEMVRTVLPGPSSDLSSSVVDASNPWGQRQGLTRTEVAEARRRPQRDTDEEVQAVEQHETDPAPVL
jgi:hypothetical protein